MFFFRWEIRGFLSGPLWLWHIKFLSAANRNNDGRFLDQSSVKQFQSLESSRSARPGPLCGNNFVGDFQWNSSKGSCASCGHQRRLFIYHFSNMLTAPLDVVMMIHMFLYSCCKLYRSIVVYFNMCHTYYSLTPISPMGSREVVQKRSDNLWARFIML